MGAIKEARLIRENFAKEKRAEKADKICITNAEICLRQHDYDSGKRIKTFTLLLKHDEGEIAVLVTMQQLKRWQTEIKEIGYIMWLKGQRLEHILGHPG